MLRRRIALRALDPVCSLTVMADPAGDEATASCLAMVDTGATRTAIPLRVLEMLSIYPLDLGLVTDFRGEDHLVPVYRARVRVDGLGDYELRVWHTLRNDAAIGWDVLERFTVSLNLA
jgi:predicted aspartyl protease